MKPKTKCPKCGDKIFESKVKKPGEKKYVSWTYCVSCNWEKVGGENVKLTADHS